MEVLVAKMTELDDRRRNERMPFWAEVWPSSVGLAREIAKGPALHGKRSLDLGCGVGVAGCAALLQGSSLDFADFFEEALAFAEFNARQQLEPPDVAAERVHTRLFDWSKDRLEGRYDRIYLGDCLYEPRHHSTLLGLLAGGLAPGGEAWVVDPCRETADPFFEQARESFDMRLTDIDTYWPDRRTNLRLAVLRPVPSGGQVSAGIA